LLRLAGSGGDSGNTEPTSNAREFECVNAPPQLGRQRAKLIARKAKADPARAFYDQIDPHAKTNEPKTGRRPGIPKQ
jgi:hypothetical protein